MKLIAAVITGVFITIFLGVVTAKLWGSSQVYPDYKHVFFEGETLPVEFIKPTYATLESALQSGKNLFLDVGITRDQKAVLPKQEFKKFIRNSDYAEIRNEVILLSDVRDILKKRKIIFNILDNVIAVHEVFVENMKEVSLEKGENFIVTSEYEAPLKSLKELQPTWLYGSTKPEILKMVAMQSMFVLEAANIRADIIIHPLKIRNQDFFNAEMLKEIQRRYKKIIVGPINQSEAEQARLLHPFAIVVND